MGKMKRKAEREIRRQDARDLKQTRKAAERLAWRRARKPLRVLKIERALAAAPAAAGLGTVRPENK
jgi:hypothetical protein